MCVEQYLEQGLADAHARQRFNTTAVTAREEKLAFGWQTDFGNIGATESVGDPVAVGAGLLHTYSDLFARCQASDEKMP